MLMNVITEIGHVLLTLFGLLALGLGIGLGLVWRSDKD